jgi:hypothetical protein
MATIQRLNTTYTKDNHNPVQMNVNKIFLYRSLNKTHSSSSSSIIGDDAITPISAASLRRRNSAELERKMREKTAHIGKKASYVPSQGQKWTLF